MLSKNIAVQCPTYARAILEWKGFLNRYPDIIKKANRPQLKIELLSGEVIQYLVLPRDLRGLRCEVVSIDDFSLSVLSKAKLDKN